MSSQTPAAISRSIVARIRRRGRGSALGAVLVFMIAIQVFRFIRLGPQLAVVSAATIGEAAEKLVATVPRDAGDMNECRELMQHTQQIAQKLSMSTTRPAEIKSLPVNPFRQVRTQSLGDNHADQELSETLEAAQSLQLDSIVPSKVAPLCMINSVLLREKQEVNAFTVDQIKSDSVIVHRGNYRFELRLVR